MLILIALVGWSLAASPEGILKPGIEVPNAIAKQHNAYVRCQDDHFDIRNVRDQRTFSMEVEKSISACRDRKIALVEEAGKILVSAPDYSDPIKRHSAISASFDGYDLMRREMARKGSTR